MRGTNGGKTGDTGADYQNLCRRNLARGGNLTCEESAKRMGRFNYRAVTGDVCMDWAREMRGTMSIARTVTFLLLSLSTRSLC